MSELGRQVKVLRADLAQSEFARKTGLSLRTITKIEAGELVRLETIHQIARSLEMPEADRLALVIAWLKLQLGDDFHKLSVEMKGIEASLREQDHLPAKIQMSVSRLPMKLQEQIHLACQRPEILRCLQSLNGLYDSLVKDAARSS